MRNATGFPFKIALVAVVLLPLLATLPAVVFGLPEGLVESHSPTVPAQHVNDVFDIANEEYKAGRYDDAVRLYEGLLSGSELKAADIYYNLGNAYFKLHNHGKAIASYRRALRLAPRDQDILANLRHVRNITVDKIDQPKSAELLHEIFFFHYAVNRAESETMFLCAYLAATVCATVYLLWKPRFLWWLTCVSLVLVLTFGVSIVIQAYRATNPDEAVVVVEEADVHTGPGDHYMLSFSLHDGAELEVRKLEEGWYQIELPDKRRGWVKGAQIEILS
ncbi:MAG: tetratricopeptide repeat protein [Candidatus Hydrogenedentota bacterium]|nr:MAG: tetratricopeptide repeat protein [Candidatus Hydrogenedentota bacterium]